MNTFRITLYVLFKAVVISALLGIALTLTAGIAEYLDVAWYWTAPAGIGMVVWIVLNDPTVQRALLLRQHQPLSQAERLELEGYRAHFRASESQDLEHDGHDPLRLWTESHQR